MGDVLVQELGYLFRFVLSRLVISTTQQRLHLVSFCLGVQFPGQHIVHPGGKEVSQRLFLAVLPAETRIRIR